MRDEAVLRGKLIRLAYSRPDLRAKILPLLDLPASSVRVAAEKVKVLFVEAVLADPSDLTTWLAEQPNAPSITGWDVKAHHMTIKYVGNKGAAKDLEPYKEIIGDMFSVGIKGYVADEKAVAVLLDLPSNLPCENKHPHITIAVNGVPPAYSNELLEKGRLIPARGKLRLKVGYFNGKGDIYEVPAELSEKI
jgi:hypothetical protein